MTRESAKGSALRPLRVRGQRLSDQVALQLKDAILEGRYRSGEQLPALAELGRRYGVSLATVREAVRNLEALELVEILHGRGVYVRNTKLQWEASLRSFSETVRGWGKVPGARLLEGDTRPADTRVAAQLGLGEGAPVHYLRRLRLADGEPLAIEESFLPADRLPDLLTIYRDPMSLYQLLERSYGVRLAAGQHNVEATLVVGEQAELLQVQEGSPALRVETIAYDDASVPVECGYSLFRADRYKYVVRLTR